MVAAQRRSLCRRRCAPLLGKILVWPKPPYYPRENELSVVVHQEIGIVKLARFGSSFLCGEVGNMLLDRMLRPARCDPFPKGPVVYRLVGLSGPRCRSRVITTGSVSKKSLTYRTLYVED